MSTDLEAMKQALNAFESGRAVIAKATGDEKQ